MNKKMFCFQCEQTAGCSGCVGNVGVCGKKSETANLQDKLTGALIGLARVAINSKPMKSTHKVMMEGLFSTITNVNFNNDTLLKLIEKVQAEKEKLILQFGNNTKIGENNDYDMKELWESNEDIRSLKSLILFGLRGVAAYAYHAAVLGYTDEDVNNFFYKGLFAVGSKESADELLPIVLKVGEINLKCMEMLDKANTETYGTPVPTKVPLTVEKGPRL